MSSVNKNKLHRRLRRHIGRAIYDFNMIDAGDRVMVCLSGGKDSYCMLDMLLHLQKTAPIDFHIIAVNLDQKQPNFPAHILPNYLKELNVEYHILEKDTYSLVKEMVPEGKTYCGWCSRFRRGILYNYAQEFNIDKIALGHHKMDIVETFFLNLFFGGTLKAMPPKLKSDDGLNIVIRPLVYCDESDLAQYAKIKDFPIIPCDLCGSQDGLQRQQVKQMLQSWEKDQSGRIDTIFRALAHISPSQLLDKELFDFSSLIRSNNEQNIKII